MAHLEILFGAPGTGKTQRLIQRAMAAIKDGTPPSAVAFSSYTRAAVDEARRRMETELQLGPDDLPNFRTVHAFCFRALGLRRDDVFSKLHLTELGELLGEDFSRDVDPSEGPLIGARGSEYLALEQFARLTGRSLEEAWQVHGGELDQWRLRRIVDAYRAFREDRGLVDFTDMLALAAGSAGVPALSLAILDEAQDLSLLQWSAARRLFGGAAIIIVGADPLQSVHRWAGAHPEVEKQALSFYARESLENVVTRLTDNYRLPRAVASLASDVASRVTGEPYRFNLASAVEGEVVRISSLEEVNLSEGDWLLLARAGYQLQELAAHARASGVVYSVKGQSSVDPVYAIAIRTYETMRAGRTVEGSYLKVMCDTAFIGGAQAFHKLRGGIDEDRAYRWEDVFADPYPRGELWHDALYAIPAETREYLLACLRRGEKLTEPPRVRIETMHGAKGQEASRVLLVVDLPPRVARGFEIDPDAEHRVFFVAVTRSRDKLYALDPRTSDAYQLFT